MVGCAAYGCSNRSEEGYLMKNLPQNPVRRKQWLEEMRRSNWDPPKVVRICEEHFTPEMWECARIDGKRKLRNNAVPTIFNFMDKKDRKTNKRKYKKKCSMARKVLGPPLTAKTNNEDAPSEHGKESSNEDLICSSGENSLPIVYLCSVTKSAPYSPVSSNPASIGAILSDNATNSNASFADDSSTGALQKSSISVITPVIFNDSGSENIYSSISPEKKLKELKSRYKRVLRDYRKSLSIFHLCRARMKAVQMNLRRVKRSLSNEINGIILKKLLSSIE